MATLYTFTEEDIIVLRDIVRKIKREQGNTPQRPAQIETVSRSMGVFVARTPAGGIPALTEELGTGVEDTPGVADCQFYRVGEDYALAGTGSGTGGSGVGGLEYGRTVVVEPISSFVRPVYNFSTTAIDGDVWIVVSRSSSGRYVVIEWPDRPSGGGSGSLTVEAVDGTPSYSSVSEIRLDEADGFSLTQPAANTIRVDLLPASTTQTGVVTTSAQTLGGEKTFADDVTIEGSGGSNSHILYFRSTSTPAISANIAYSDGGTVTLTVDDTSTLNQTYTFHGGGGTFPQAGLVIVSSTYPDNIGFLNYGTNALHSTQSISLGISSPEDLPSTALETYLRVSSRTFFLSHTGFGSMRITGNDNGSSFEGVTDDTTIPGVDVKCGLVVGGSLTSSLTLNGQTGTTQTFADVDDTNVTLAISSSSDTHTFTMGWSGQLSLARGGTGANLVDPNADRILFWDDSAGAVTWLRLGTSLAIVNDTLDLAGTGTAMDGIDSLNGLTNSSQTFADVDDTNVTLAINSSGTTHTFTIGWSGQLSLARGGTGANLSDPGADRIMFWDDSAGTVTWLTVGTGLSITDTTISATATGTGDVVGPASATDNAIAVYDGTTGKLIKNSGASVVSGSIAATNNVTAGNLFIGNNVQLSDNGGGNYVVINYNENPTNPVTLNFDLNDGTRNVSFADNCTLSGTNTGDQTITLTGDVTGSGTGSFAATIANDAVTYAKMQNVSAADRLLGRGNGGGSGDVQEISLGNGLSMSSTTISALGALKSFQVLTSGTGATYTRPAGITSILVELVGGGGGGGGAEGTTSEAGAAPGGGAGSYARKWYSSAASSYTYSVGAGGGGGSAGNNAGTNGGDTTFDNAGTVITAPGGLGGNGTPSGTALQAREGAQGGAVASNGDVNGGGAPGGPGIRLSGTQGISGHGGSGPFGGGGRGRGVSGGAGTGVNAVGRGAGGGGAYTTTATDFGGGDGSAGLIVVWEFS